MAEYYWAPAGMTCPVVLPGTVADQLLTLATPEQLRVLLWLARHGLALDAAACGAAVGLSPEECAGCVRFWMEQGVLTASAASPVPAAVSATTVAATPLARPAAVKPQLREVLSYQQQHPEFSTLVEEVSARLGKPIGHSDTATLLYLRDTVGLPYEVILMEVGYAVSIGKPHMRYIEKMALDWADRELTTLDAVDAHIQYEEACQKAGRQVETWLALTRPLTAPQRQTAYKWLEEWHTSEEMLRLADGITRDKTGKFSPAYTDRILERWRAEGIDTPEKAQALPRRRSGAAATNPEESSLDLEGFEEELMQYTPVFQVKKRT